MSIPATIKVMADDYRTLPEGGPHYLLIKSGPRVPAGKRGLPVEMRLRLEG